MGEELFRVEVNEEGKRSLQHFAKLSLIVLLVTLLFGTVETVSWIAVFQKAVKFAGTRSVRQGYVISMAYGVVNFALQTVQVILYRRFALFINRSISRSDSEGFNGSFRFLVLQSVCFLLQLLVGILFLLIRFTVLL